LNPLASFVSSSIGRKWIVALTGLAMLGFLIGHLVGNLQIFLPPEYINKYAAFLKSLGELLWIVRLGLLACVVLHVVFTIKLALENRAARPQKYEKSSRVQARISTRTMVWSGSYILCFIVVHLLHFTAQTIHPEYRLWIDEAGRSDVYRMMIVGFRDPLMAGFYIVGMILLCAHLSHGIGSIPQTLGMRTKRAAAFLTNGGRVLSLALALGFISIPSAVLLGGLGKKYVEERTAIEKAAVAPEAAK
jgi:succinate dehydrogenase / fumarate reductase, cytochrome b subunit